MMRSRRSSSDDAPPGEQGDREGGGGLSPGTPRHPRLVPLPNGSVCGEIALEQPTVVLRAQVQQLVYDDVLPKVVRRAEKSRRSGEQLVSYDDDLGELVGFREGLSRCLLLRLINLKSGDGGTFHHVGSIARVDRHRVHPRTDV